jgi:uncharacterized membrane protein
MDDLAKLGRLFFAVSLAFFGLQYLLHGRFMSGLPPVPPWTPGGALFSYLTGVALIAASVSIAAKRKARLSATLLGILFFLCVILLHALHARAILLHGNERTGAFEALAISSAAFVLAGALPKERPYFGSEDNVTEKLATLGRFFFALSMVVFGVQHFLYAGFIASLEPSWIPGHLFWAYFTGVGFIAAGPAIAVKIQGRLAAFMLGLMFFLWVTLLHAPRVAAGLHNADEWTSLFVALAMCGGSLIVAGAMSKK